MNLYTDWLLNSSIAENFDAFKKGFDLVMNQAQLADLFVAEEVELLICGSNVSMLYCLVQNFISGGGGQGALTSPCWT